MGSYDNYKRAKKIQRKVLALLPIEDYLVPGDELEAIMDHIQMDYERDDLNIPLTDSLDLKELVEGDIMRGYVFNWMEEEEFASYLRDEYGVRVLEETITKYWISSI